MKRLDARCATAQLAYEEQEPKQPFDLSAAEPPRVRRRGARRPELSRVEPRANPAAAPQGPLRLWPVKAVGQPPDFGCVAALYGMALGATMTRRTSLGEEGQDRSRCLRDRVGWPIQIAVANLDL